MRDTPRASLTDTCTGLTDPCSPVRHRNNSRGRSIILPGRMRPPWGPSVATASDIALVIDRDGVVEDFAISARAFTAPTWQTGRAARSRTSSRSRAQQGARADRRRAQGRAAALARGQPPADRGTGRPAGALLRDPGLDRRACSAARARSAARRGAPAPARQHAAVARARLHAAAADGDALPPAAAERDRRDS